MRPFRLRAVLFDFDGTLTVPGAIDFAAVKRQVGCPPETLLLEFVEAMADGEERVAAEAALELFELEGAAGSRPNAGAEELVHRLRRHGLRVGVITRNRLTAVTRALETFPALRAEAFDVVVTRDDDVAPKPAADGVLHACEVMGVDPKETLVVGDFLLDVQAGRAAGAMTAFLTNAGPRPEAAGGGRLSGQQAAEAAAARQAEAEADFVVHGLAELDDIVTLGTPLPAGKLPAELLARHLAGIADGGAGVLVGAAIGEDVAALDVASTEVLVAHGDPITLAGRDLGRYAVMVNANDIATSGAEPRWLLTTVLFPAETTPSQALTLLSDIATTAAAEGMTLIGGHSEISDIVARPLVAATALGTLRRADLRDKRGAATGDDVILTKSLAIEGTALLAHELGDRLRALGMSDDELATCRSLLDQVSIVPEARIAAGFAGVRAMHDVTEGGLATALHELAVASGQSLVVHRERITVLPETVRVCTLLGADPLGLIASGSLLLTCRPDETSALLAGLQAAGIAAATIGHAGEAGAGVTALERGRRVPWPTFPTDEAARLLGS